MPKKPKILKLLEIVTPILPAPIYWEDVNSVLLGGNEAVFKATGALHADAYVGKTLFELYPHDMAVNIKTHNEEVMRTGNILSQEEVIEDISTGQLKYFTAIKACLKDDEGNVIGIVGTSVDITARKQMEEALRIAKDQAEVASQAKSEFIANMGHDIRTPLTGIIGFSQQLEEAIENPEYKEWASQIHQSGEQLLGLLNGVLDMITAHSTNENQLILESFDVRRVLQDVLELELPAVKARGLGIEVHVEDSVPHYVVSDRMKLHRIILNLTGNAIKFTKEGHIELNARLLELKDNIATIEFAVKDTGVGIPDAMQDKVFDRFFKVNPSHKGLYSGNGIGLHIVKAYVDLLKGNISLASKEGVGTTISVVFSLPVGEKTESEPTATLLGSELSTKKQRPYKDKKIKVLLIEDNTAALNVLKLMIQKFDVQISTAVNAELAYELVQSKSFDLIITDLGLPGKQGDELAMMIREYEKAHHRDPAMIIGLSGHAVKEVAQTCLKAGMDEVHRKPMKPKALKVLMEQFSHSSHEELAPPISHSNEGLREDLPKTEKELLDLQHYPLLDLQVSLKLLGNEKIVREIFISLQNEGIRDDLESLKIAHQKKDWVQIEKLAHKIKGGSVYGTVRLYYALLYMEKYCKSGQKKHLEALFTQMLQVIDETMSYLYEWSQKAVI